jgi:hypothetical protein
VFGVVEAQQKQAFSLCAVATVMSLATGRPWPFVQRRLCAHDVFAVGSEEASWLRVKAFDE